MPKQDEAMRSVSHCLASTIVIEVLQDLVLEARKQLLQVKDLEIEHYVGNRARYEVKQCTYIFEMTLICTFSGPSPPRKVKQIQYKHSRNDTIPRFIQICLFIYLTHFVKKMQFIVTIHTDI